MRAGTQQVRSTEAVNQPLCRENEQDGEEEEEEEGLGQKQWNVLPPYRQGDD